MGTNSKNCVFSSSYCMTDRRARQRNTLTAEGGDVSEFTYHSPPTARPRSLATISPPTACCSSFLLDPEARDVLIQKLIAFAFVGSLVNTSPSSKDVGALSAAPPNRVRPNLAQSPQQWPRIHLSTTHSTHELLWIKAGALRVKGATRT